MLRAMTMGVLLAVAAVNAAADEAQIRRVVEEKLGGGVKVEGVQPGPLGLYEVRFRSSGGTRSTVAGRMRNAGLNLTDRLPVLKNILMRQAMS